MSRGLATHHLLAEDIEAGKYSDDEIKHLVYPKMRHWLGLVTEENEFAGGTPKAKAAAWQDVCAIVQALPSQIVRDLACDQSLLVVLITNQLDADVLAESFETWELTCEILRRCLHACGNLLWQDESSGVCIGECISDLLGIASKCFVEPGDPYVALRRTMRQIDSSRACLAAQLCMQTLAELITASSEHWTEVHIESFAYCLCTYVSNGALDLPDFENMISSLLLSCAKHVRTKYADTFEHRKAESSPIVYFSSRYSSSSAAVDAMLTFDGEFISQICSIKNKNILANPMFSRLLRLHAAVCTCPCAMAPLLCRRHRSVARLMNSFTAYNLPARCQEIALECFSAFVCSGHDVLLDVCGEYIRNYIAGLKFQLQSAGLFVPLAYPKNDSPEIFGDIVFFMAYGLRLGVTCNVPAWFVSGLTKAVDDIVAKPFFDQFLSCDTSPLGSNLGCFHCQYIFAKVWCCLDIISALLLGSVCPDTKKAWDIRAESMQHTLINLLITLRKNVQNYVSKAREQRTSQSCVSALMRRMLEIRRVADPDHTEGDSINRKRPVDNDFARQEIHRSESGIQNKSVSTTMWLENLGRARREIEREKATESKLKKLNNGFAVEDLRTNPQNVNSSGHASVNDRLDDFRISQKSKVQVGSMGAAKTQNRPPSSATYAPKSSGSWNSNIRKPVNGPAGLVQHTDGLDICQDGPKDFESLDVGYTDYEMENKKRIRLAALAPASTKPKSIMDLLGQARSERSSHGSAAENSNIAKLAGSSDRGALVNTRVDASSTEDFMNKVSIEKFYRHVLSIRLEQYTRGAKSLASIDYERIPNRFFQDDQYIDLFLPLLLAEVKASIGNVVEKLIAFERRTIGMGRQTISDKKLPLEELFSARCVLVNRWVVSGRYSGSLSDRHLQEKMMSEYAASGEASESSLLDEAHIVVKSSNHNPLLNKDDFVVIVNEAASLNDQNRTISSDYRPINCVEDLLESGMFSIGVVVSSSERGSSLGNNRKNDVTYSLLMVAGTEPSVMDDWRCLRLTNITTHLREWSAIASVRQQSLMPLTPYIMRASPVVSSQGLLASRDYIRKIALKLHDLVRGSVGRAPNATTATLQESLCDMLLKALKNLLLHRVDGSVVKASGIIDMFKELQQLQYLPSAALDLVGDIKRAWKLQIKEDHKSATLAKLHGGCVVPIPQEDTLRVCPAVLSPRLWEKLLAEYNASQLFAIRYVVEQQRFDIRQDTQISLIQGPPGTGKTKTILGMVSALLQMGCGKKGLALSRASLSADVVGSSAPRANKNRLLICAPSNAAVDELLSRLSLGVLDDSEMRSSGYPTPLRQLNLVRLGNVSETSSEIIADRTLEKQTDNKLLRSREWLEYLEAEDRIKALVKHMEGERNLSTESGANKKASKMDLIRLHQQRQKKKIEMERRRCLIRFEILDTADVVLATLSGAGSKQFVDYIEGNVSADSAEEAVVANGDAASQASHKFLGQEHRFETVLIDEAAQATEPSTLIPLRYGCTRLVLVGDPRQLPATVLDSKAAAAGLSLSLFERLERSSHEVVMLQIQYRMHPDIRAFPSVQFYEGNLIDSSSVQSMVASSRGSPKIIDSALISKIIVPRHSVVEVFASSRKNLAKAKGEFSRKLSKKRIAFTSPYDHHIFLRTVEFFDITNSMEEKDSSNSKTLINVLEARFICSLIKLMSGAIKNNSIGIITPYEGQKRLIQSLFSDVNGNIGDSSLPRLGNNLIEVNTVDGFQGREKDVIVISCVRTSRLGIGFLDDDRRMNVAITRAKKCLIVVGNAEALQRGPTWNKFVEHCAEFDCLSSIAISKIEIPA